MSIIKKTYRAGPKKETRKREKERESQPEFQDSLQVRHWILVLKIGYETHILLNFLMVVTMFGGVTLLRRI